MFPNNIGMEWNGLKRDGIKKDSSLKKILPSVVKKIVPQKIKKFFQLKSSKISSLIYILVMEWKGLEQM